MTGPVPMDHHEKMRIRAAAFRATRLFPGAVGQFISNELLSWEGFGYRLGGAGLIMRLVNEIMTMPMPEPVPSVHSTDKNATPPKWPHRTPTTSWVPPIQNQNR